MTYETLVLSLASRYALYYLRHNIYWQNMQKFKNFFVKRMKKNTGVKYKIKLFYN